jgi:3-hydroxyisobutyrate dehydrogenase-like beta-hydroxyacid dehydrogenase
LYVDANAVSPERARRMGEMLRGQGAQFVDGCVIGLPAKGRGQTWVYLSGAEAEAAAAFFCGGPLEVEVLGPEIGQASALKMCFAAQSKGNAALLAAVVGAAEALGVRGALERQWGRSGPNWERAVWSIQHTAPKAWRFVAEMEEIAGTFESAGVPGGFPSAAKEIFARMSHHKGETQPELEAILRGVRSAK